MHMWLVVRVQNINTWVILEDVNEEGTVCIKPLHRHSKVLLDKGPHLMINVPSSGAICLKPHVVITFPMQLQPNRTDMIGKLVNPCAPFFEVV